MAEEIAEVKGSRMRYDWANWTNGRAWRCRQGRDFTCKPMTFRAVVYNQARRLKRRVTVSVKGKFVEFQFDQPVRTRRAAGG